MFCARPRCPPAGQRAAGGEGGRVPPKSGAGGSRPAGGGARGAALVGASAEGGGGGLSSVSRAGGCSSQPAHCRCPAAPCLPRPVRDTTTTLAKAAPRYHQLTLRAAAMRASPEPHSSLSKSKHFPFSPLPPRGVYRSDSSKWQHPEATIPPGSHLDPESGGMRSPMQVRYAQGASHRRDGSSSAGAATPCLLPIAAAAQQPGAAVPPLRAKPLSPPARPFAAARGRRRPLQRQPDAAAGAGAGDAGLCHARAAARGRGRARPLHHTAVGGALFGAGGHAARGGGAPWCVWWGGGGWVGGCGVAGWCGVFWRLLQCSALQQVEVAEIAAMALFQQREGRWLGVRFRTSAMRCLSLWGSYYYLRLSGRPAGVSWAPGTPGAVNFAMRSRGAERVALVILKPPTAGGSSNGGWGVMEVRARGGLRCLPFQTGRAGHAAPACRAVLACAALPPPPCPQPWGSEMNQNIKRKGTRTNNGVACLSGGAGPACQPHR